jgi:AcrR family transcriptional regulator
MPKDSAATRAKIIDAAYTLFYREGFARIGVDEIAAEAGVTKRTLYYHFDSKDALLAAVMEAQNDLALARVRQIMEAGGSDASAMMRSLFTELAKWAASPRWHGSGFTRVAMDLAGQPGHPARKIAARHKAAVETLLTKRLTACRIVEARAVAGQVMLLTEGCLSLILIHCDTSYANAALAVALRLVDGQATTTAGRKRST